MQFRDTSNREMVYTEIWCSGPLEEVDSSSIKRLASHWDYQEVFMQCIIYKGVIIMRTISAIIVTGTLAFFISAPVLASDAGHTSEAMEHAGKAQAHGEMGHAKESLEHAKESLAHAKAARDDHAASHKHMDEAIKHLEEAIKHADMGHGQESAKHTEEAMKHMRQSGH
jgi:hypothetical protein